MAYICQKKIQLVLDRILPRLIILPYFLILDELECTNIAAKTSDLEEVDKETIHFLVFLFMQYLSHPDQAGKSHSHDDENSSGKNKDDQHMSGTLLGHSFGKASEKAFLGLFTLIGKKYALKMYDQFTV